MNTWEMLSFAGRLLDLNRCYLHGRTYHFDLGDDWSIATTAESMGRWRVSLCHRTQPRSTLWVLNGDRARLAHAILGMRDGAMAAA